MSRPKNKRYNVKIYCFDVTPHENSGIAIGQEKGIVP